MTGKQHPSLTFPPMDSVLIVHMVFRPVQPCCPRSTTRYRNFASAELLSYRRHTCQVKLQYNEISGSRLRVPVLLLLTTVGKTSMIVVNACSIPPRLLTGIDGARTMAGHRIPPSVDQAEIMSGVGNFSPFGICLGSYWTLTFVHPGRCGRSLCPSWSKIREL